MDDKWYLSIVCQMVPLPLEVKVNNIPYRRRDYLPSEQVTMVVPLPSKYSEDKYVASATIETIKDRDNYDTKHLVLLLKDRRDIKTIRV
jgi:hypothetical protein